MAEARFYVYIHRRGDTGEVFYVGKGVGIRALVCSRRALAWRQIFEDCGRTVEFLAYFYVESDALDFERQVICELRGSGVALVNMTAGGQGTSGYRHTEQSKNMMASAARGRAISQKSRRKISEANKGRVMTAEHRARLSQANLKRFSTTAGRQQAIDCQKGRVFSEKHRERISASKKGVVIGPRSPEIKARMAEAQRKRFEDPAEREKIRQARLTAGRRSAEVVHG